MNPILIYISTRIFGSYKQSGLFIILTILSSCSSGPEKKTEEIHEELSTVVELTDEQQQAIDLKLSIITYRNLSTSLKANGKLELPPQNKAQVSTLAGGIVKSIPIREGELVKEGQTLATIENMDFIQLQQDYLEAVANLAYSKAEYERQGELQKENINSGKIFQQAESDFKSQLSKASSLKQKLLLFGVNGDKLSPEGISSIFRISAPISGHITRINISMGKYLDPNSILFEIVDNRFLHIDLTIFEQDIHKIHESQTLTFSDANDPTHVHTAEIFSINKTFENNQQAVIAHAKILHNTEALLPGMFIEARINTANANSATLPSEAIVSSGNEHFIFILQKENHFLQVQVRIGETDMGFTEIIPFENVDKNTKVVTNGAYYLFSQLTKGDGEHHH